MRKLIFSGIFMAAAIASADQVNGSIHGDVALRLYDNLERTGVEAGSWTDNQGVKHYTLNTLRKVICDYNSHTTPNPAQCIMIEGFMDPPRVVTGLKARNLVSTLSDAASALEPQGLFLGDCAMGHCTLETAFVDCYFDGNAQDKATCDISQGNPN